LVRPEPAGHRHVRIRTLLAWRCVDCHGPAGRFDRARLAQNTHVYLVVFAAFCGATRGMFSLTGTANKVGVIDSYLARERSIGRVLE
jgi:hypothetical protein